VSSIQRFRWSEIVHHGVLVIVKQLSKFVQLSNTNIHMKTNIPNEVLCFPIKISL